MLRCVSVSPVVLTRRLAAEMLEETVGLAAVTVLGVLEQGERGMLVMGNDSELCGIHVHDENNKMILNVESVHLSCF